MRTLIAGVGNILRGDDGFGIALAHALRESKDLKAEVEIFEAGIAGISLVQELMNGFDVLIIADAVDRGGKPGTLYLIEPGIPDVESVDMQGLHSSLVDSHYADPSKVLLLAQALNVLPPKVFLVGCQPEGNDELGADLSPSVRQAVPLAVQRIEALLEDLNNEAARLASS